MSERFLETMKRCRNIDFAFIGQQVEVSGHIGTIVGANSSANLDVIFSNQAKFGKDKHNCHPFYETRYFDKDGNIVADYRKVKA